MANYIIIKQIVSIEIFHKIETLVISEVLFREDKKDANSTLYSQAVTHPSTNRAQCCLTSVIGRELVYSR